MKGLEHWLSAGTELPVPGSRLVGLDELDKGMVLATAFHRTHLPIVAVFANGGDARNAVDNFKFFAGAGARDRVHYVPAYDFDYYRGMLPNPAILCERNEALYHALNDPGRRLFVTSLTSLLQKAVPPAEFTRATRVLQPSEEIERDALIQSLLEAGYQRQPNAYDPGIFSVRGGVVDIYCPLYRHPLRLEFFGDLIDEIRFFEPQSQRSLDKIERASIIPVGQSLIPHGDDFTDASVKIRARLDQLEIPKTTREEVLERIAAGQLPSELSFLFPLLSRGSSAISEYFPKDAVFIWDGHDKLLECARDIELPRLYKSLELYEKEPLPIADRESLFLAPDDIARALGNGIYFESFASNGEGEMILEARTVKLDAERAEKTAKGEQFAKRFKDWIEGGYRVQVVCHTQTHVERVASLFGPHGVEPMRHDEGEPALPSALASDFHFLHLRQGLITQSREYPMLKIVWLAEDEIFGHKKRSAAPAKSAAWQKDAARLMSSFRDLKEGDFVVHRDHGIGRYLGLKSMNFLEVPNDYVLLEYKDGDKLYIPVYRLNVLQKYSGGEGAAPVVDKLGGDRWGKAKSKAQRAIAELAGELLQIQAKRKTLPGHAFAAPGQDYTQFEMEFPFDETPDQQKAIDEVNMDLNRPHPMDRLICGDVGYGKTEVAMRASYRAVLDGKQVSVLVPTTVLAFQHFENFKNRFKSTGARVEMVSRLRSAAESKKIIDDVKVGKVDVLIGTHRLLSADIQFKDLGLVIVDEEHRFGVTHKERLKKIAESVHFLTMTATPIPRTLNMAMMGIKEISVITTPPPDRLAVRTFVCRNTPEVVQEAIANELARDGQVFFVHNRIESIFVIEERLKKWMPKLKIDVAHGQMDGDVLEKKMLAFYRGETAVLLTTSIIESGLDVPRANTIIIDDAHHMGLAQLYQLRGRVGRSDKRAYCYMLVPGENLMTDDAKQRLQVIQRYTDLGAGFSVASHDLEIRGAGDLLGKSQSGHLNAIGLDMYFDLLEEAIAAMQGEEKAIEIEPEITMKIAASFPNDYLPDISERILLYRRLSSVENEDDVARIEEEIRDRFGSPPPEVINLIGLMRIKLYLKRLHVVRMSCGPKRTSLQFADSTPANPERLVRLVTKDDPDDRFNLTPDQKLVFEVKDADWRSQLKEIQWLADYLGVGDRVG